MTDQAPVSTPTPSSDPAPSNTVGTDIGNISSIYDLGARVFDKVTDVWQQGSASREKKREDEIVLQELIDGLGEWEPEAKDEKGRWRQPYLGKDAYEKHFVKTDGRLEPCGTSTATFGWAQLLFALNIRPKGKGKEDIITWRKLPRGTNPAKTGTLSLAVDGVLLCHIINLYQLYRSGARRHGIYRFPFGDLALEDDAKHVYTLTGLSDTDFSSEKLPFRYSMEDVKGTREDHLRFDPGFFDIQYQYAISNGLSGIKAELVKSKPGEKPKPLQERADSLVEAMQLINQLDWSKPCIMSPEWAEDASRIKRRVTSGKEDFLIRHVIDCLSKKPDVVESLKDHARKPEMWQEEVKSGVQALCMSQRDSFKFVWNDPRMLPSAHDPAFDITLREQLPWIMQELGTLTTPSLEQVSPATLLEVLKLRHEIINAPVIVLREVPKEWNFTAEINS
jgi:hypothetical protein